MKEEGYEVEAVQNLGCRIGDGPDAMTAEELHNLLDGRVSWAGNQIRYYAETDSTNTRAKKFGDEGAPHGTLVVTEKQTDGRGRRGRAWESPENCSIYMSLLLRPKIQPVQAPMLTIVMAYTVARALRKSTGLDVQIKWPNDIILNGKKIVGILTEMSTEIEHINYVVIGVGINVNIERFPEELADKATSLQIETGQKLRRALIAAGILAEFESCYEEFLQHKNLEYLRKAYNEMLVNCGREVCILGAQESYKAQALGIDENGELLVRREDGAEEAVYAGEVSVRGVYGYV